MKERLSKEKVSPERPPEGHASREGPPQDVLSVLDPHPDRAVEEYKILRSKLVQYFKWNNCWRAEELADETICRAQRRISEGKEVYAERKTSFFYGIANNVRREEWKSPASKTVSVSDESVLDRRSPGSNPSGLSAVEQRILLKECLRRLTVRERNLVVRYSFDGPSGLLEELQISPNALRIRVCRIKRKLEECYDLGRRR